MVTVRPLLASLLLLAATPLLVPSTPPSAPPAGPAPVAAPATPADGARITRVVAFPQHAEVTRELVVDAVAGLNTVVFRDLGPDIVAGSLRASGGPGVQVTGTKLHTQHLAQAFSEELAALDAAITAAADALASEQAAAARLKEEAAFYSAVKGRLAADMGRELHAGQVDVDGWRQVLGFVREGLTESDGGLADSEQRLRELKARHAAALAARQEAAGRQPAESREVTVSFTCAEPGRRSVAIHTMVETSIWKPSYDVHLDRAAGTITITGYGQVAQWTGEDWQDIQLTLAMSRPDVELALPELQPLVASLDDAAMGELVKEVRFLGHSGRDAAAKWTSQRFQRAQDRETFRRNLEQLARRPAQQLAQYGLSQALVEQALGRLIDRFAAVRYAIPGAVTVPTGTSAQKVVAFQATVPARLTYVASPALGDTVMLRAACTNTTGHPILEGGASLFVDGAYVGTSASSGAAANEPLSFVFGPDDSLTVARTLVSRTVKGPEAFRQSQVITYTYALSVVNFAGRAVEVEVTDQLPVSKSEDIQVELLSLSATPDQLEAGTGTLRWSLAVEAGATNELTYSFSVECPVGADVHWK